MSTRRRVWVSRGQNTLKKYSPPCQNHPVCPLDHACFVFGRSRRCNANFPHRNLLCVWTIVWGGRNMVPTGAWPILMLRGVSQPTPNAPEVPRAIGLCLDICYRSALLQVNLHTRPWIPRSRTCPYHPYYLYCRTGTVLS